ncbi:hypothetical protein PMAYCL1PPCAC_15375, partial [Pristionchus mayeri]
FTKVTLDTDELTANLGREQLDLFDTKCIAAIYRDTDGVVKRARKDAEQVIAAASASYLAIGVGSTLNLFTASGDLGYVCSISVSEEETILDLKWLADTGFLVIATNKAKLCVYSVTTQKIVILTEPLSDDEWKSCCLDDFYNLRVDGHALFVSADNGIAYRIVFDAWRASFVRALSEADANARLGDLFGHSFKNRLKQLAMGDARFEQMTALSFKIMGGRCVDGVFRQVEQPNKDSELRVNMRMKGLVPPYFRARLVGNGSTLAILTREATIEYFDLPTMTRIDSHSIPRSSSESAITDFAFLEWPGTLTNYEKIALIVQKGDGAEMQIREVDSLGAVAYAHEVVGGSLLVQLAGPSEDSDRLAMIVEPADERMGFADQTVCVRDVVETQPEQRLSRLIARRMLDEAERFAFENGLDVQLVHSARVEQLLQQLMERPNDEGVFEAFLKATEKIDKEAKADWVLGAIAPLKKAEWISRLLEYAEKEGVVDPTASLASIAYNFATYRMVFGPNAEYGSVWAEYQYSPEWAKEWLKLLTVGNVAAARIIWHRYPKDMQGAMDEGLVVDAIRATQDMLLESPNQWQFAIDHLEADVLSMALGSCQDTNQVYKHFIEFLVRIAAALERQQPEAFPDNALYAVSAVERLVNRMKKNALTSMRAAEFLASSSKSVEDIEAMYKRSRDLRAIKRLKETYECPLSYEKYKRLSTKEVCHEILQRSVQNPAQVRDRIDRIARPFMEEHSLPVDETLLGHIEKVTSIARCQSSSEPLDVHCLLVTDAIHSAAIRARAVLRIADAAPIPWCAKLTAAVQNVMGDKKIEQKIKDALSLASSRMRLGAICQNFGLDREYIDAITDSYASFVGFIRYLLTGSLTSTREITDEGRWEVAAEAVSIYDRLCAGVRPLDESPRVDMREYILMLIQKDDLASVHKFVEKQGIIDETIDMLVTREETADYSFEGDKEWQSRRTSSIVAINSLIQRHRREDSRWKETYVEMRKMHSLVTTYSMDVSLLVLRSPGMKANMLHRYMRRSERKLRECLELSSVLGLSHDDTFLALLDYSAPMCPRKLRQREKDGEREVDVTSALYLCKKAMQHAQTASTTLLRHVVHVAELVMDRIFTSSSHSPMSVEDCVAASDNAEDLDEILPTVIELDVDMMVTERALSIHRAVRLIRETVRQMQQGQQTSEGEEGMSSRRNSIDEEEMADTSKTAAGAARESALTNGAPLGLSNRRRLGAYDASMDNPILETADTMRVVCGVAFMIHGKPDEKERGGAEKLEEMEARWSELFSELSLASQYMLEMHARVLYTVWGGRAEGASVLRELANGSFVERLVQHHPCDLLLLATIFASLEDKDCNYALTKLLKWAKKDLRKSPQTMLNMCRLAQLLIYRKDRTLLLQSPDGGSSGGALPMQTPAQRSSAVAENAQYKSIIKECYTRAMWEKKLGKKKIPAPKEAPKAVLEFASHMLSPEIVIEYLNSLSLKTLLYWDEHNSTRALSSDRQAGLIASGIASGYLPALLTNAVKAKEDTERDGFLITADNTIELLLSSPGYSREALRSVFSDALADHLEKHCCPYAHEVIQFVLAKLIELGDENEGRWTKEKKVADFICLIPREFSISTEERAWYTARINAKNAELDTTSQDAVDELNFAQMPEKASSRLPFHLLLSTHEADVAKYVVPITWHEITLPNLQDWYDLLRDVHSLKSVMDMKSEKLKLKRPMLITKAVMKYIKAAQEQNDQLSESDMEWIQERLYSEKNVLSLLYTFNVETVQVAPQGNTRIQLLQLGYNVTKKFLDEQPENAPGRDKIADQQKRLRESLREMNTKRLLQSHKIFNQDTSPFVKDVDRLISRIYDRFINWDEPTDVQQKCALIKELAKTNDHDLEETHQAIVGSWLCGESGSGEGEEGLPDVDMNDVRFKDDGMRYHGD